MAAMNLALLLVFLRACTAEGESENGQGKLYLDSLEEYEVKLRMQTNQNMANAKKNDKYEKGNFDPTLKVLKKLKELIQRLKEGREPDITLLKQLIKELKDEEEQDIETIKELEMIEKLEEKEEPEHSTTKRPETLEQFITELNAVGPVQKINLLKELETLIKDHKINLPDEPQQNVKELEKVIKELEKEGEPHQTDKLKKLEQLIMELKSKEPEQKGKNGAGAEVPEQKVKKPHPKWLYALAAFVAAVSAGVALRLCKSNQPVAEQADNAEELVTNEDGEETVKGAVEGFEGCLSDRSASGDIEMQASIR